MRTYLVSYDLANPALNRSTLASALMHLGQSWARPLEATWYVRVDGAADEIERWLKPFLGEDDGLLVQEVANDAALVNTALRWFRPRREAGERAEQPVTNVLPFRATNPARQAAGAMADLPADLKAAS